MFEEAVSRGEVVANGEGRPAFPGRLISAADVFAETTKVEVSDLPKWCTRFLAPRRRGWRRRPQLSSKN